MMYLNRQFSKLLPLRIKWWLCQNHRPMRLAQHHHLYCFARLNTCHIAKRQRLPNGIAIGPGRHPPNAFDTAMIHEAQMIPTPGQVFLSHGCRFEVLAREGNRITQLKIRPL